MGRSTRTTGRLPLWGVSTSADTPQPYSVDDNPSNARFGAVGGNPQARRLAQNWRSPDFDPSGTVGAAPFPDGHTSEELAAVAGYVEAAAEQARVDALAELAATSGVGGVGDAVPVEVPAVPVAVSAEADVTVSAGDVQAGVSREESPA